MVFASIIAGWLEANTALRTEEPLRHRSHRNQRRVELIASLACLLEHIASESLHGSILNEI